MLTKTGLIHFEVASHAALSIAKYHPQVEFRQRYTPWKWKKNQQKMFRLSLFAHSLVSKWAKKRVNPCHASTYAWNKYTTHNNNIIIYTYVHINSHRWWRRRRIFALNQTHNPIIIIFSLCTWVLLYDIRMTSWKLEVCDYIMCRIEQALWA